MKKIIYLILGVSILTTGCSSNKQQKEDIKNQSTNTNTQNEPIVYSFIRPLSGYFALSKVNKTTELSLDSIQFAKEFQFAATMDNKPASINFQQERVGAIVLPESAYDTEIVLDTNFVKNDTLHVLYQINTGKEKKSFTTVPVQLFSYNSKFHLDLRQNK